MEEQQQDGAADGQGEAADAPVVRAGASPQRASDEAADDRAGDPEQDGDDEPAGIFPGHKQLGDAAGDRAEDDPSDDGSHVGLLVVMMGSMGARSAQDA